MIRPFVLLSVVALLGLLPLSPALAADTGSPCGDAGTAAMSPREVRVDGVDCATGKRLARRHANRTGRKERCDLRRSSCKLDGWTCRRRASDDGATKVSCKLSFGRVAWVYAV